MRKWPTHYCKFFFTNIEPTLVSQINNTGNQAYTVYLINPRFYAFDSTLIDVDTTRSIIDRLNSKFSYGKYGILTSLIKS